MAGKDYVMSPDSPALPSYQRLGGVCVPIAVFKEKGRGQFKFTASASVGPLKETTDWLWWCEPLIPGTWEAESEEVLLLV